MADESVSQTTNGDRSIRELYEAVGELRVEFKESATRFESYAAHTNSIIEQLAHRIDAARPNLYGLATISLVFAGLIGGLFTVSTDGKIQPVKNDIAHLEEIGKLRSTIRDQEIATRWQARDREIELRDQINALEHGRLNDRLAAVELAIKTRYSDNDDAQNARIDALQHEIELIRSKNP